MKDNLKSLIDEKKAIENDLELIINYEQRRNLERKKFKISSKIDKLRKGDEEVYQEYFSAIRQGISDFGINGFIEMHSEVVDHINDSERLFPNIWTDNMESLNGLTKLQFEKALSDYFKDIK